MLAVLVLILRILLLVALLSFLGWTVYTLWRDLQFHSQSITSQKVPHISVFRDGDPAEVKQIYTRPELQIGRDPSNDIRIDDETVSNHHAKLIYKNKHWWIEDLLSTNGTFLNDERVETPTILISGDELKVGRVLLGIEIQPTR